MNDDKLQEARRHAAALKGFYIHLGSMPSRPADGGFNGRSSAGASAWLATALLSSAR
jgi:hypothetical protein